MAASKFVDSIQAAAAGQGIFIADTRVRRLLARADIREANDVTRLDHTQLERLLENKSISEKIMIKTQLLQCGLYPNDDGDHPIASRIRPLA